MLVSIHAFTLQRLFLLGAHGFRRCAQQRCLYVISHTRMVSHDFYTNVV